jgi:hypothetical protein
MVYTIVRIQFWNDLQAKEGVCCVEWPIQTKNWGGGGDTHDDVIEDSGIGLYTIHEDWASPFQHYLETCTFPKTLNKDQRRRLAIKILPYSLVGMKLHNMCGDGIIHTCVSSTKAHKILE